MSSFVTSICNRNPNSPINMVLDCDGVLYIDTKPIFFSGPFAAFREIQVCIRNPLYLDCREIDFQRHAIASIPPFTANIVDILEDGTAGNNSFNNVTFTAQTVYANRYQYKIIFVTDPLLDLSVFEGCEFAVQLLNRVPLTIPIPCIESGAGVNSCFEFKGKFVLVQQPSPTYILSINKIVTSTGPYEVGDQITYEFRITNSGNQTLTNVVVTDTKLGFSDTIASIAAGQTIIRVPTPHTVTQGDLNNGEFSNQLQATSNETDPVIVNVTVPLERASFTITKSGFIVSPGTGDIGDVISYTFIITNTGTVNLLNVFVTDPLIQSPNAISPTSVPSLAPGASTTFTATYTINQDDVNVGNVTNTATGTATPENGTTIVNEASETVIITTPGQSSLSLSKTVASITGKGAGDTINYEFLVTNTGTVLLNNVAVADSKVTPIGGLTSLNPGESTTFTGAYTILAGDVTVGFVTNTATATADPSNGQPQVSDTDSTTTTIVLATEPATLASHFDSTSYALLFNDNLTVEDTKDQRLHQGEDLDIPFTTNRPAGDSVQVYWNNGDGSEDILGINLQVLRVFDSTWITVGSDGPYTIVGTYILDSGAIPFEFSQARIRSFDDGDGDDPYIIEVRVNNEPNC